MSPMAKIAAVVIFLGGVWWWNQPPSSTSISKNMVFSEEKITYNGVDYQATWNKEPISYTGDARANLEEYNPFAPFNTHVVALTSGSYSDTNVTFTGRIETDGKITSDKGKYIQYGNMQKGRPLLLLSKIEIN